MTVVRTTLEDAVARETQDYVRMLDVISDIYRMVPHNIDIRLSHNGYLYKVKVEIVQDGELDT